MKNNSVFKWLAATGMLCLVIFGWQVIGYAEDSEEVSSGPGPTAIKIVLEKESDDHFSGKIIDVTGHKENLNLGSLLSKAALLSPSSSEEIDIQVQANAEGKDPNIMIMLEQGKNGELTTVLIGYKGRKGPLTFGRLVKALKEVVLLENHGQIEELSFRGF